MANVLLIIHVNINTTQHLLKAQEQREKELKSVCLSKKVDLNDKIPAVVKVVLRNRVKRTIRNSRSHFPSWIPRHAREIKVAEVGNNYSMMKCSITKLLLEVGWWQMGERDKNYLVHMAKDIIRSHNYLKEVTQLKAEWARNCWTVAKVWVSSSETTR